MESTFVLTADLDPDSFAWLDGLRRRHFPPERNLLSAHLTLFHRLSSAQTTRLEAFERPRGSLPILFDAPILLGAGVAIGIRSPELGKLRSAARDTMGGQFSRQDAQTWRPHVTVQNKVSPDAAKALHRDLTHAFEPRAGEVPAFLVWEYLGGPWKLVTRLPFA